jgi:hypothetical protein
LLPVYSAHSFEGILPKGGRTQPWLILVNEGDSLVPYVAKMFTPTLVNEHSAVLNEVIGNVLAREFDVNVPEAALITMDDDFEISISDPFALSIYPFKDNRIKFATKYVSGPVEYQPGAYTISEIEKLLDFETLFAYDFLIQNRDRNYLRPNFFISNGRGYSIDHEKGFALSVESGKNMLTDPLLNGIFHHHIFYDFLKNEDRDTTKRRFETFQEYLRTLNINSLQPYFNQLAEFGHSIEKQNIISDYLTSMKSNCVRFVERMREVVL